MFYVNIDVVPTVCQELNTDIKDGACPREPSVVQEIGR